MYPLVRKVYLTYRLIIIEDRRINFGRQLAVSNLQHLPQFVNDTFACFLTCLLVFLLDSKSSIRTRYMPALFTSISFTPNTLPVFD